MPDYSLIAKMIGIIVGGILALALVMAVLAATGEMIYEYLKPEALMGHDYNALPDRIKRQVDRVRFSRRSQKETTDAQTIFIGRLPPGLNGSEGLMNMHWSDYRDIKKDWVALMAARNPKAHVGRVKIRYTRVSTKPMDFDNLAASFKVVGDALVDNGVLEDDSPSVISELAVRWDKADRMIDQGVRIEIEDI